MAKKQCRICRKPDNDDLISVQLVQDQKTIADMILSIAGVSVTSDRRLPQNICLGCLERLNVAYQLRQQCIESDTYLRRELLPTSVEYSIEKSVDDGSTYIADQPNENQSSEKRTFFNIQQISEECFDDETCARAITDDEITILEQAEKVEQYAESDLLVSWHEYEHYLTVDAQSFTCCGCASSFDSEQELKVHSVRFHRKSKYRSKFDHLQCTICYQTFHTRKAKEAHQAKAERKTKIMFQCLFCNALEQERENMVDHLEQHHAELKNVSENNQSQGECDRTKEELLEESESVASDGTPATVIEGIKIEIQTECQNETAHDMEHSDYEPVASGDEMLDEVYDVEIDLDEDSAMEEDGIDGHCHPGQPIPDEVEALSTEDEKQQKNADSRSIRNRMEKLMWCIPPNLLRVVSEESCYSIVERVQKRCCCCMQFFKSTEKLEKHLAKTRRTVQESTEQSTEQPSVQPKYICEYCGTQFEYSMIYVMHKRIREQRQFYMCHLCKKLFGCESRMKSHMLHSDEHADFFKLLRADIIDRYESLILPGERCCCCWKYFDSHAEMLEHFRATHADDGPNKDEQNSSLAYACEVCSRRFAKRERLELHRKQATNVLQHYCKWCSFQSLSQRRMELHLYSAIHRSEMPSVALKPLEPNVTMERRRYCCFANCALPFRGWQMLFQHVRESHGSELKANNEQTQSIMRANESDGLVCDACGLLFKNVTALKNHQSPKAAIQQHLVCSVCGVNKRSRAVLLVHERTHTGERPYGCEYCDKSFGSKTLLNSHLKCHLPRQYECGECNEKFARLENLKRHVSLRHSEATHQCVMCPKKFKTREVLSAHIRTHTGEKPYKCRMEPCDKRYVNIGDRRRHEMSVHTLERPHKCSYCDTAFIRKRQLVIHERRHTGHKPFVCRLCGKAFYENTHLNKHSCAAKEQT